MNNLKNNMYFLILYLATFSTVSSQKDLTLELFANTTWNKTLFCYHGYPLVTGEQDIKPRGEYIALSPQYTVLKSSLQDEENVYITLNSIKNAFFHLYERRHPDFPNYRIQIEPLSIQKCDGHNQCNNSLDCEKAFFDHNNLEPMTENVLYISWKKLKQDDGVNLVILVQYKQNLLICKHSRDSLNIFKLLINTTDYQSIWIDNREFPQTHLERNINITIEKEFNSNDYIHLRVLQCIKCEMYFKMTCDDSYERHLWVKNISDLENAVVFRNGFVSSGWKEVILCAPSQNQKCVLQVSTYTTNQNWTVDKFWIFAPRLSNANISKIINKCDELYTTTPTTTTTFATTTGKSLGYCKIPKCNTSYQPPSEKDCSQNCGSNWGLSIFWVVFFYVMLYIYMSVYR